MARQPRVDLKNHIYHVINRANARATIFHDHRDYELFEATMIGKTGSGAVSTLREGGRPKNRS